MMGRAFPVARLLILVFVTFRLCFLVVIRLDAPFSGPAHPWLHVDHIFRHVFRHVLISHFIQLVLRFASTLAVSFVSVLVLVVAARGFFHLLVPCESTLHVGLFSAPFLFIHGQVAEFRVAFAARLRQRFQIGCPHHVVLVFILRVRPAAIGFILH